MEAAMKAAFLTAPCRLEVRDEPWPALPSDGLVVEVMACGICGSDLRRWRSGPPPGCAGMIPGHEIAGVVSRVGPGVRGWSPGDRIAVAPDVHCGRCWYCRKGLYNLCDDLRLVGITPGYPGGFAQAMAVTGEILLNGIVHRIPDGVGFVEAAVAEPACSVIASHEKVGTSAGRTVLVMGAGPIGCLHVAIAKARGAKVVVSEPSAPRRAAAERFGPDAVIDPSSQDVVRFIREFTGGLGADMAICANPVAAAQAQAVQAVRKAGRVVLFGGLAKDSPMTVLDANRIHYGEIEVVGSFSYLPEVHAKALELIAKKVIPAGMLVTHTFALEEISGAFQAASGGEGLKVVVTPNSSSAGRQRN